MAGRIAETAERSAPLRLDSDAHISRTPRRFLSPREAAGRACVSANLIYAWCADGTLPHVRAGAKGKRGKILIAPDDLDEFLAARKVGGRVPPTPPTPPADPRPVRPKFRHLKL